MGPARHARPSGIQRASKLAVALPLLQPRPRSRPCPRPTSSSSFCSLVVASACAASEALMAPSARLQPPGEGGASSARRRNLPMEHSLHRVACQCAASKRRCAPAGHRQLALRLAQLAARALGLHSGGAGGCCHQACSRNPCCAVRWPPPRPSNPTAPNGSPLPLAAPPPPSGAPPPSPAPPRAPLPPCGPPPAPPVRRGARQAWAGFSCWAGKTKPHSQQADQRGTTNT